MQTFAEPLVTIGSSQASLLQLNEASMAPEQFVILRDDEQYWLINRAEGTRLNRKPLACETRELLREGDEVEAGEYLIRISLLAAPATHSPQRSFAQVLDGLRTEDDCFSFVIAGGPQNGQRVLLSGSQMVIGWDEVRQQLAFEEEHVATPWVLIRKDWSGVAATSTNPGNIVINGEKRGETYRLHHNNEIELGTFCWEETSYHQKKSGATITKEEIVRLIFQEPLVLARLKAILPEGLPQPVIFASQPHDTNDWPNDLSAAEQLFTAPADTLKVKSRTNTTAVSTPVSRRYFGSFTLREMLFMALGTACLTLLLFVVLNLL